MTTYTIRVTTMVTQHSQWLDRTELTTPRRSRDAKPESRRHCHCYNNQSESCQFCHGCGTHWKQVDGKRRAPNETRKGTPMRKRSSASEKENLSFSGGNYSLTWAVVMLSMSWLCPFYTFQGCIIHVSWPQTVYNKRYTSSMDFWRRACVKPTRFAVLARSCRLSASPAASPASNGYSPAAFPASKGCGVLRPPRLQKVAVEQHVHVGGWWYDDIYLKDSPTGTKPWSRGSPWVNWISH